MSEEIKIQFYIFNQDHFAIPIESAENGDNLRFWKPTIDLISQIVDCKIIANSVPDWLNGTTNSEKWEPVDEWAITPRIIVLFTDMKHLHHRETYQNLVINHPESRYPVRIIQTKKTQNIEDILRFNCPIIMVGTEDIMNLYGKSYEIDKKLRTYPYRLNLDPRLKFWDSSIWHRYVSLDERPNYNSATTFRQRFKQVFQLMSGWMADGLYATFVALENIELQTQLMLNSTFAEVGPLTGKQRNTLFKFHSETQMEHLSLSILDTLRKTGSDKKMEKNPQWRLLLIDEYGDYFLACNENEEKSLICTKSKKELIQQVLNGGLMDEMFQIVVDHNHSSDYIQMLKKESYNVILLDNLSGEGNHEHHEHEAGREFLSQINLYFNMEFDSENSESFPNKNPMDRFWIFFISSFPSAYADMRMQLGLDDNSDFFYHSGGGDPVCTPMLFRYNLFNFIKKQVADKVTSTHSAQPEKVTTSLSQPKKIVTSFAKVDQSSYTKLEKCLIPIERQGLISCWSHSKLLAGANWDDEIKKKFSEADIILLLVSASFLASDYINTVERKIAKQRHTDNLCHVVPIILEDCDWKSDEFIKSLQALPNKGKAIRNFKNAGQAWLDVTNGIRNLITQDPFIT